MHWSDQPAPQWPGEISNRDAKEAIAEHIAARATDGEVIGIGSGSTSFLALLALARRVHADGLQIRCVPTSEEIAGYCTQLGMVVSPLLNARPDWCFDGADEVDPGRNLIKGRGGAFVREKIVFAAAPVRFVLVDESKFVDHLGTHHALPLEVLPDAVNLVRMQLRESLGVEPQVRPAGGKDGGVITEQGGLIMDLALDGSHDPSTLNTVLNNTVGITATGLFVGFELEIVSGS